MAFPGRRSSATTESGTATTHAINMPATISAGDILLMVLSLDGNPTVTTPSGWTLLTQGAEGNLKGVAFYKSATGSEDGSTVNVTVSPAEAVAAVVVSMSDAGVPETTTPNTGNSEEPDPPSLTPAGGTKDYTWLAVCCADSNNDPTEPSSYTLVAEASANGVGIQMVYRELNASSTDPGVFAYNDPEPWVAMTIAFSTGSAGNAARSMYHALNGVR